MSDAEIYLNKDTAAAIGINIPDDVMAGGSTDLRGINRTAKGFGI